MDRAYLEFGFFMEVLQPSSGVQRHPEPHRPRCRSRRPCGQVVGQAPVRHELVDEQQLHPPLVVLGAVSDELDEVGVLHHPEHVHLRHPLLVALETLAAELLDGDVDAPARLGAAGRAPDGAPVDAAEAALAEHLRAAEPAGGGPELLEGEDAERVGRPLRRRHRELPAPAQGAGAAELRRVEGAALGRGPPHVGVRGGGRRRAAGGGPRRQRPPRRRRPTPLVAVPLTLPAREPEAVHGGASATSWTLGVGDAAPALQHHHRGDKELRANPVCLFIHLTLLEWQQWRFGKKEKFSSQNEDQTSAQNETDHQSTHQI